MTKVVQIPSRITVGDYEFAVKLVDPGHPALNLEGDECHGATFFDDPMGVGQTWTIYLSNSMSLRLKLNTVIHEITHGINHNEDVEAILENKELDTADKEEKLAEAYGRGWARFYADNPRYVRWLNYVLGRIKDQQTKEETVAPTEEKVPSGN